MPDKIAITFDEKNKPTTKGGTFYVTINGEKTSKRYRWCIYKKGNGNPFINEIKEDKKPLEPMKFGSFGKDGGTFIIKIYDAEKVKGKENSELSKFSEEASLEIEIKKEEEKPTTRHNIKPDILEVHLIKKGTGSITKVSYQDTLIAIAKTQGLEGKKITFNLYERDEKDKTHVKDFLAEVDRYGMARVEIPLLSNKKVFQFLANQKAPENGEGNKHEFFVMASFGLNKNMITKDSNEVQAHLKKNIKNAYFVDANGKKINKIQVGNSVRVCIESEDMIGVLVKYKILEKDIVKDDEIWDGSLILSDDKHIGKEIKITKGLFNTGIDFWGIDSDLEKQNYYIKVEAYADKKESSTFELSFESVVYDVGVSPVKIMVDDGKKKEEEEEEPSTIVTYHIYHDGRIEKHIPKKIAEEFKQKYKYVYHDEKGGEHDVCVAEWHTIKEKGRGENKGKIMPTHSEIISDENIKEGQTQRRVIYQNEDIAEYGYNKNKKGEIVYFWVLYKAKVTDRELIRMPDSVSYEKNNVSINYTFSGSKRRYTSPDTFAGFIGALAKTGLTIQTTGSCFKYGSSFPSLTHINGKSVDTIYLKNRNDEIKFINSLKDFGFDIHITGTKSEYSYEGTQHRADHNSHLHSGFNEKKVTKINI